MTQEEKLLLLKDLCARLPYGVRGKVKADTVIPHRYDIDGFPLETTFDVDVELQRIDVSNDEIFVSTFDNNEDLGNYIEECQADVPYTIEEFTPYLRPMSSMTEQELHELAYKVLQQPDLDLVKNIETLDIRFSDLDTLTTWLNSRYLDYRGLIEKGLALKATEGLYNIKD